VPKEPILLESDGSVRIVTLNSPETRNAFDTEMVLKFIDLMNRLDAEDSEARAVVLTGAGSAFSAGGSLASFEYYADNLEARRADLRRARRLFDDLLAFHLPIIAAVNGPAVGLGCTIATACDIVLISDDAYLADPHVVVGLVAGDGSAVTWPFLTSLLRAKRYLLTGDRIAAQEAVNFGLANEAFPSDLVVRKALELAQRIATLPPEAVQDTKLLLNQVLRAASVSSLPYGLAAESQSHDAPSIRAVIAEWKERKIKRVEQPKP